MKLLVKKKRCSNINLLKQEYYGCLKLNNTPIWKINQSINSALILSVWYYITFQSFGGSIAEANSTIKHQDQQRYSLCFCLIRISLRSPNSNNWLVSSKSDVKVNGIYWPSGIGFCKLLFVQYNACCLDCRSIKPWIIMMQKKIRK